MAKQLDTVNHSFIRYANCWEDADLLIEALDIQENDKILSIGSAGDNSFSLLINNPKLVVAVDINKAQLNLIALKKAAIIALEYNDFLQFLGFEDSGKRKELFEKVKTNLPENTISFWEERIDDIEKGIINSGKFEQYFKMFNSKVLPLIHSKSRINKLFSKKSEPKQVDFYINKWNNFRWNFFFKIFFSKFIMGRFGRDKSFLKQVDVPVSSFILNKAKAHLSAVNCQNNYFLEYILKGRFEHNLPHYARKVNFEKIKKNIDKLVTHQGLVDEVFVKFHTFNKFNLSNIFEYMNAKTFEKVTEGLIKNGDPNSIYIYWNLMVNRRMSEISDRLIYNNMLSEKMSKIDKGFFYSKIIIDKKHE